MKTTFALLLCLVIPLTLAAQEKPPKKKERDEPGLEGLKALRNADEEVRYKAAVVLARLGPVAKFASAELREVFKVEKVLLVKVKMAEAIWSVDRPPATVLLPFLLEAAQDTSSAVRIGALGVVGQIGPKARTAVPDLIKALADPVDSVRIAAIVALGEVGPAAKSAATPLLAAIDEKNKDFLIDTVVASALGKLGPTVAPLLTKTLKDKSSRRRLAAVYALGDLGAAAKEAVPELEKLLAEKDELTQVMVLQTLGKIGSDAKSAAEKIEPFLKSASHPARLEAALSLHLVGGGSKGLSVLMDYLQNDKLGQVYEAILAMKHFGPLAKEAAPALKKKLGDRDFHVRMAAALAHWAVTGKADETLKIFEATIDNSDNGIRRRTLEYLDEMGPAAAPLRALIQEAARDEDEGVRHMARLVLAKLK